MQKVVGSSPIIRFENAPGNRSSLRKERSVVPVCEMGANPDAPVVRSVKTYRERRTQHAHRVAGRKDG